MGARTGNSTTARRSAAAKIGALLAEKWPDAHVELDHANAYQLVVATILSAQSTDKMINTITPALFAKYPDPASLARANPAELEQMIFRSGFYRNKAKSLIGMAKTVVENHGGVIPDTMEALTSLPGVARKTANVVLGSAMHKNVGVVVDTHVTRLSQRLGLTRETDPVKIEQDLMEILPQETWTDFAHRLIWHGRRVCLAKAPDCDHCLLRPHCPTGSTIARPAGKLKKMKAKPPTPAKAKPAPAKRGRS
jgi:endonuclease-3